MRTRQLVAVLMTTAAACLTAAGASQAASFTVEVTPADAGTAAAPKPVAVGLRADLTTADGFAPPALRAFTIAAPDGFALALAGTTSCTRAVLESAGPGGCPASSKLGSGSASLLFDISQLRVPAFTRELSVFRGPGDELLVYVLVTQPATFSIVVPGRLMARPAPLGPLVTLDFSAAASVAGGSVTIRRASFDLVRGLAAGPCPAKRWTFGVRLAYFNGGVEDLGADAVCLPDVTRPELQVTARSAARALGARFAVVLSEAATVRLSLERRSGRRWVRVRKATFRAAAGPSVLRVRRANGRLLASGRYRARLRAVDAAGLASEKISASFRLR